MNRAAWAARFFFAVALVPTVVAASFAAYEFHTQPPAPVRGSYRTHAGVHVLSTTATPGLLFGSYCSNSAAFSNLVGRHLSLTVRYMKWWGPLPETFISASARLDAKTVIELRPGNAHRNFITMTHIIAGKGDSWLKSFAHQIVSLRQPIILSFAPEMNGIWWAYGSTNVKGPVFVAAFRHVHDTLIADINHDLRKLKLPGSAAELVTFMWQPSAMHRSTPDPKPDWPGSRYVDVVGLDGYYNYLSDTFDTIFGKTVTLVHSLTTRPIMIGETAAGTLYGGSHQAWAIKNLVAGIKRNNLLGFIWFDQNQLGKPGAVISHQDWLLEESPKALAAFKSVVQSLPIASFAAKRAR